eukprot:Nitzschia sp. Nitz4//scaffold258_size27474//3690//11194//NITZ4_008184-RA/size27474-augustus-gene-0.31-mRNA-1//1//CDS//3329544482//9060//frame0
MSSHDDSNNEQRQGSSGSMKLDDHMKSGGRSRERRHGASSSSSSRHTDPNRRSRRRGDDRTVTSHTSSGSGGTASTSTAERGKHRDERTVTSQGSSGGGGGGTSRSKRSDRERSDRPDRKPSSASSRTPTERRKRPTHGRSGSGSASGTSTPSKRHSSRSSDDSAAILSEEEQGSSEDESNKNQGFPASGGADFGAAFGSSAFGGSAAFDSAAFDTGGGAGAAAADAAADGFGSHAFAFDSTATTDTKAAPSSGFDNTFSAFSSDFGSFPAASGNEDSAMFSNNAFGGSSSFVPAKTYDTSPLENPPTRATASNAIFQFREPRPVLVQQSPPTAHPVGNPLNGNVLLCRKQTAALSMAPEFHLVEWNPHTQAQVLSTPVLSTELQRKIAQKYNVIVTHVDTVLTLTVGIHQAQGYWRPRVACLLDLAVEKQTERLRLIVIWQWGYGTSQLVQLQSILSPPSKSDFSYNPTSLLVADSCVFVGGASKKGPCVFMCKPTVKDSWSANFVGKEAARIAHMAVTNCSIAMDPVLSKKQLAAGSTPVAPMPTRLPYLAIALTDGSLSVWTYEAVAKVTSKTTETIRRLLFPLCKLEGTRVLRQCPTMSWEKGESTGGSGTASEDDIGYCTHLEWVAPKATAHNQLLLLSASFQGGHCLYHVALPKVQDSSSGSNKYVTVKPPNEKTQLSQTPVIQPFSACRWPSTFHFASASFCDVTPQLPLSLSVLLTGLQTNMDYARLFVLNCKLPMYGLRSSSDDKCNLQILDSQEFQKGSQAPRGLVPCSSSSGILYHTDSNLELLEWAQVANACLGVPRGGASTVGAGLSTNGEVHLTDASTDKDGILHIFTILQCERRKKEEYLEWGSPSRRHWLVQTYVGDCSNASGEGGPQFPNQREEKSEDDPVAGGSTSVVVCELGGLGPLSKLVPFRVARHSSGKYTAVWFRSLDAKSSGSNMIALVEQDNTGKGSIVQVVEGRDLAFLPTAGDTTPKFLLLNNNGGKVSLWERSSDEDSGSKWVESAGSVSRPLIGVDVSSDETFVECKGMMAISSRPNIALLAVGARLADGVHCILAGKLDAATTVLTGLLPNMEEHTVFWFDQDEIVIKVLPLPDEKEQRGGVAVATSQRVLVFSPDLQLLSSVKVYTSPSSLVPLGSFTVAYPSSDECSIRYVCGLPGKLGVSGVLAGLPLPQYDFNPNLLLAVRPDRMVFTPYHLGSRLVERGQDSHQFLLPVAVTRPALLLEPMIANAIATGRESTSEQPFLRSVVEKFGRKVATMIHGEGEGLSNFGAGITPRVYELLQHYKVHAAASWLLTGTSTFDRSANRRLLPSWIPVTSKVKAGFDADTNLHVIANGDQYFAEYIKSPDNNMAATLPRPSDPSSFLTMQFGKEALEKGDTLDALKLLDVGGTETTDMMMLQLALASQTDTSRDTSRMLNSFFQSDAALGKPLFSTTVASLASLSVELRNQGKVEGSFTKQWMRPLAPSMQRGRRIGRMRTRIIGESTFDGFGAVTRPSNRMFASEPMENKLVWNEGPNREKDNLLMLDHIQEWFGRRRPLVLGKEGVKRSEDRGTSTLADLLAQPDDDSFGGDDADDIEDGWVDGVGEGIKDEDKLSVYYRFSEGEDEESSWREEGFADLSKFEVTATLVGCKDTTSLQESTSSVDEGEPGKVKALYDLVFENSGVGMGSAVVIPSSRGGSLDVGMMHGPDHTSRQKCTVELWFWVPESISEDIVLLRRTFGSSANDFENVCKANDRSSSLWELSLSPNGEVEFKTIAGSKIVSEPKAAGDNDDDDEDEGPTSTVKFSRWNHVAVTFKQESLTNSMVNVLVKGESVCSEVLNFKPPGIDVDEFSGASGLDTMLEKSHILVGVNHPAQFRITELRLWALEREDRDIRATMKYYLEAAEMKRKFRVKIKKQGGGGGGKFALGAPKESTSLKKSGLVPLAGFGAPKPSLAPPEPTPGRLNPPSDVPEKPPSMGLLAPPKGSEDTEKRTTGGGALVGFDTDANQTKTFSSDAFGSFDELSPKGALSPSSFGAAFGATEPFQPQVSEQNDVPEPEEEELDEEVEISPLWDSAIPLSEQVRSSAAAALIRGPPATRHFGGNRGGLPDYRQLERFGVGAISICGSEKTIVWRDDQVPPGLTYPIGASGAIVSDQMDEDGSEFLCCFLAKDKRMVVFELSTRTVVVELQMTTKLNYWRFLPPEAGEDTLCFMLITPVGGFHWMPLDESPRPRQVWKRGGELQGKKIVSYEEGGTNGLDGPEMLSKVGLLMVSNTNAGGQLEAWLVPICGDSQAVCASDGVLGACLCQPPDVDYEAWMPLLLFVVESEEGDLVVCVSAVTEASEVSIALTDVMTDALIEMGPYEKFDYAPPTLAMGTWPEVLCCSLGSTIVIISRRKGLVVAYELADAGLELIAQENVGHYVVDAVMRYSAVEGGAEIVLLMSDDENPRDGRVGTFCFRTAA